MLFFLWLTTGVAFAGGYNLPEGYKVPQQIQEVLPKKKGVNWTAVGSLAAAGGVIVAVAGLYLNNKRKNK
jgi:hypothetical protein